MATIYAGANPASGGIYAGDPTQATTDLSPALAGSVTASSTATGAVLMAQQLAGAAIAAAAAAAQATLKQALQAAAQAGSAATGGLSTAGGNAKLVTPILRNSTYTAIPQQSGVKWVAIDLTTSPPSLVAAGADGVVASDGHAEVQNAALLVGTEYGLSVWTADGYSVSGKLTAQSA